MTSLYSSSVPFFILYLDHVSAVLTKAENWAKENGVSEAEITALRLSPDMLPLTFQVRKLCVTTVRSVRDVGGFEKNVPTIDGIAETFAGLQQCIAETKAFLETVPSDCMNGKETETVIFKSPDPKSSTRFQANGEKLMRDYYIPDFSFHFSMLYALLRIKGVPLGKMDFIGYTVLVRVPES